MITKTDAIAALEKVKMFFEQFETGRFDQGLHIVHNEEIQGSKVHVDELMNRVRKQLKFGELWNINFVLVM